MQAIVGRVHVHAVIVQWHGQWPDGNETHLDDEWR